MTTKILAAALLAMLGTVALAAEESNKTPAKAPASPLDFTVQNIEGKDVDLAQYKGKVVLLVNVASKCGYTKQYAALESMYEAYKDKGFVVLGFPANNFKGQEPGTNAEILEFCTATYKVKFPMMSKVSVLGEDKTPVYKFLTEEPTAGAFAGDIKWNFTKFLIGKDGKVIARYEPKVKPDDAEVKEAVETAIAK